MSRRPDRAGKPLRQRRARRPSLESLEGRELLTTFTVTSALDNGNDASPLAGSLRAAIVGLNLDTSPPTTTDSINFAIPGAGVQTIALQSSLQPITRTVSIDGLTESGSATPTVVIDGSGAGAGAIGLTITSGGQSEIRGLSIVGFVSDPTTGFGGAGIFLEGPAGRNILADDYIGVEPDGVTAKANSSGVLVFSGANTIGGTIPLTRNVISGNAQAGVILNGSGATGNLVLGNSIGTNAAESAALGNTFGVLVTGPGNTIGGTALGAGNVIAGEVGPMGQNGAGILFEGQAPNNLVEGNLIGTNRAGTAALLPTSVFPSITYSNAYGIYFGSQGDTSNDSLTGETVGGSVAGAGNLISGNFTGITGTSVVVGSVIAGNTFGLNLAGTAAIPNNDGILLGASQTTLGGTTPAARNIISGTTQVAGALAATTGFGLTLQGDSDAIEAEFVGVNGSGVAGPGTGNVVGMSLNLTNSTIGGSAQGATNIISGNSTDGIQFAGSNDGFFSNAIGVDILGNPDPNGGNGIVVNIPAASPPSNLPSPENVSIGGTAFPLGNIIADNGGAGVLVSDANPAGVTGLGIRGTSIFGNARLGIDTQGTGVPVPSTLFLTGSNVTSGRVTVTGVYSAAPGTTAAIDLFANATDPSGFGQGPIFLGTINVTTAGTGFTAFAPSFPVPAGLTLSSAFSATATGPDGNTSGFSANFPTTANAPVANLVIASTASSGAIIVGDTITFVETVHNYGPSPAANTVLYDTLPSTLVNASATPTVGSASVGANNLVTANLGTLLPGATVQVVITARASMAGTVTDQPGVASTSFDQNYFDNTAQTTVTVAAGSTGPSADLAIVESASRNPALVGSPLTYTITVGNLGPNAATNATVFDTFPGTTLVGVSPSQGAPPSVVGNAVTVALGNIAPGATATITLVVMPTAAGSITNMASVNNTAAQFDPVASNNYTSLTTPVRAATPNINLFLAQSPVTPTGAIGQLLGFTLIFQNFGTDPATNVILNDLLPANARYYYSTPSQGGPPTFLPNGLLSTNFGTVAPGGIATLQLLVVPVGLGTVTNIGGLYSADVPTIAPSFASASAAIVAGPSVAAINGFGGNSQVVLTFNEALNPATALNPINYQLVSLGTSGNGTPKAVKIASVTYNAVSHSVMLLPAQALDPKQYYKITVFGATPSGIADVAGRKLAGTTFGPAGGTYSTTFFAGTLPQI